MLKKIAKQIIYYKHLIINFSFFFFQNPKMRQKYFELKDVNEHMLKQLENGQQELDVLNSKIENLQEVRTRDQISIKRQGRHASVYNSE